MTKNDLPAIFSHSLDVYEKLESLSKEVPAAELLEYGYPAAIGETVRVYIGHSTKDAQSVGLAPSTAQHCMNTLKAMRCISMLRIGSKIRPSVYILHYKPTVENYIEYKGYEGRLERRVNPNNYDVLVNDIVRINEKIAELQRDRNMATEVMDDLSAIVRTLVARVRALEAGTRSDNI